MTGTLPGLEGEAHTHAESSDQFFPTPAWAVDAVMQLMVPIGFSGTVLDLGAGDGGLISRILAAGVERHRITAVERRPQCEGRLRQIAGTVVIGDALEWADGREDRRFDLVVSNPPFGKGNPVMAGGLMLAFGEAMMRSIKPGGHCWELLRLEFMETVDRAPFLMSTTPDALVFSERVDFMGTNNQTRAHAWFHFPGSGRWRPIGRRDNLLGWMDSTHRNLRGTIKSSGE